MSFFYHFGEYIEMLGATFSRPEKRAIYFKRIMEEANAIGVDSLVACGVLALIAGTLGRSFIAAIILVLSGLAGVAFLVFAGISVVIFFLERPQGLIPPPLRSRPPRTGANMQ